MRTASGARHVEGSLEYVHTDMAGRRCSFLCISTVPSASWSTGSVEWVATCPSRGNLNVVHLEGSLEVAICLLVILLITFRNWLSNF